MVTTVDDIFLEIGELGGEQWKQLLLISLIHTYYPFHMMSYSFTAKEQDFTCHTNDNETTLHNACPNGQNEQCLQIRYQSASSETSAVSEWTLICDRSWLRPLTMSLFMGGVMVGALLFGFVSDGHGRRFTVILTLAGMVISGQLGQYAQTFTSFCLVQMINGFFCGGHILPLFVLLNELIGPSKRGLAAIYMAITWSCGLIALSVLASNIRYWRDLTGATTLIGIPMMVSAWFLLESPRWFLSKGNFHLANAVLQKIAEGNGKPYKPEYILKCSVEDPGLKKSPKSFSVTTLFRPSLLKITMIMLYAWFVNSSSYYGLTLAASNAKTGYNIYWATAVSAFVEIPACFGASYLIDTYGRMKALSNLMIGAGCGLLAIYLLASFGSIVFGIATISKLFISASFTVIYIHTGEIYPTVFRNTAMGVMAISSRFGGIASPYLAELGSSWPNLHFIVFGLLTFSSGIFNRRLPETQGQPLPESLEDLLDLVQKPKNSTKYEKLSTSII
ncbi:organic cation transporter protein-like [Tigriopus californicus]|uniref:organic cation transporter protein-like n=1 Tax=Tigriopus californicus TaxID=6832 RepID=UPI0027DA4C65|nr:organic cation transporter protein-like [Tigriopus californicus]